MSPMLLIVFDIFISDIFYIKVHLFAIINNMSPLHLMDEAVKPPTFKLFTVKSY